MDVGEAKRLYVEINSIPGELLGLVPIEVPARAKLDALLPAIELVGCDLHKTGDRCFSLPSPWHAFLLMFLKTKSACDKNLSRPIYRGQADSEWNLIPSLGRTDCNRDTEGKALERFCDDLQSAYSDSPSRFSRGSSLAVAQHYGIATNLLDFTPDPAVALFFACFRSTAPYAAIFQLPLLAALEECQARVLMPPPIATRVYLQRGMFLECAENSPMALQAQCTRIEFPPSLDFRVVRQGVEIDPLGDDDPFWESMVAKARNTSPADPCLGHSRRPSIALGEWIDQAADLLYWLALDANTSGQQCQIGVLHYIKRDNPLLIDTLKDECRFAADRLEEGGSSEMAADHRRFAKCLEDV